MRSPPFSLHGRGPLVLKSLAAVVVVGAAVAAFRSLPGMLARVPLFDVATVRVEGARLVDDREILERAGVPDSASVWDDPSAWEAAVAAHPVVRRVRVRRRLPSTLVLEIEEREPVAFVATPVLEPVDIEGRILPVDPSRVHLDLPVVRLRPAEGAEDGVLPPHRLRRQVEAVAALRQDPAFHGRLSELREEADGSFTAFWGSSPSLRVKMRLPVDPARIDAGLSVLGIELENDSTATPRFIDVRWDDQVVVGLGTG